MLFLEAYWIPIRASLDRRLLAPTQSLSQLATPFIGFLAKVSNMCRLTESYYFSIGVALGTTPLEFRTKRLGRK